MDCLNISESCVVFDNIEVKLLVLLVVLLLVLETSAMVHLQNCKSLPLLCNQGGARSAPHAKLDDLLESEAQIT